MSRRATTTTMKIPKADDASAAPTRGRDYPVASQLRSVSVGVMAFGGILVVEAAELFVWASAALLVLMAVPLVLPEGRARQAASLGAFLGTLIVSGLGYNTGENGGKLVYEHGAAQVHVANGGIAAGVAAGEDAPGEDSDSE